MPVLFLVLFSCNIRLANKSAQSFEDFPDDTIGGKLYNSKNKSYVDEFSARREVLDLITQAALFQESNDFPNAIITLLDALRLDSSRTIFYLLAENFYNLGKLELAYQYALESFRNDSTFHPTVNLLVNISMDLGRYSESIFFSQKLLKLKGEGISEKDLLRHAYILLNLDSTVYLSYQFCKNLPTKFRYPFAYKVIFSYSLINLNDTLSAISAYEELFDRFGSRRQSSEDLSSYLYELLELYLDIGKLSKFLEYLDNYIYLLDCSSLIGFTITMKEYNFNYTQKESEKFSNEVKAIFESLCNQSDDRIEKDVSSYIFLNKVNLMDSNTFAEKIVNSIQVDSVNELERVLRLLQFVNKTKVTNELLKKHFLKFQSEPNYIIELGKIYFNDKKYDSARYYFEKAMEHSSYRGGCEELLAYCYFELGNYELSDSLYEKAIENSPDDAMLLNNYSYTLIERDIRKDYSKKLIDKAFSLQPKNPYILDTYGWWYFKNGDFKLALYFISLAKDIIEDYEYNDEAIVEIYLHLAEIYYNLDDYNLAKFYFDKANSFEINESKLKEKIEKMKSIIK